MAFFVIFIAVVASIVISIYRAKKIEQQRKEEKRRHEQKYAPKTATTTAKKTSPAQKPAPQTPRPTSAKKQDPFPAYQVDPFGNKESSDGCMSAQEFAAWRNTFAFSEQTGATPRVKGEQPVFARFLHTSGFNYRSLRKACGFAPQNRLPSVRIGCKKKPTDIATVLRNEGFTPDPLDKKTPHPANSETQHVAADALAQKSDAHTALYGFYEDVA